MLSTRVDDHRRDGAQPRPELSRGSHRRWPGIASGRALASDSLRMGVKYLVHLDERDLRDNANGGAVVTQHVCHGPRFSKERLYLNGLRGVVL